MKPSLFLILAGTFLFSCKPEVRQVDLFDMQKLVEEQKSFFENNPSKALRVSVLNQTSDTLQLDSFQWESELEAFKSFDLNNTRYKTDYLEEKSSVDGNSVMSYTLPLPRENFTGIYELKITFKGDSDIPHTIEALELANNLVYTSSNQYFLEFDGSILQKVTVEGKQDLMMKEPLDYRVVTELRP